jgi:hypothetical protein
MGMPVFSALLFSDSGMWVIFVRQRYERIKEVVITIHPSYTSNGFSNYEQVQKN